MSWESEAHSIAKAFFDEGTQPTEADLELEWYETRQVFGLPDDQETRTAFKNIIRNCFR